MTNTEQLAATLAENFNDVRYDGKRHAYPVHTLHKNDRN